MLDQNLAKLGKIVASAYGRFGGQYQCGGFEFYNAEAALLFTIGYATKFSAEVKLRPDERIVGVRARKSREHANEFSRLQFVICRADREQAE